MFQHGKRQRRTALLHAAISRKLMLRFLDKFINIVIPAIGESQMYHQRRRYSQISYQFRFQRFFEHDEIASLLTDRLLQRDIFIPLTLHLRLNKVSMQAHETLLRILRLPLQLYKHSHI
jgi:hypothetical protein